LTRRRWSHASKRSGSRSPRRSRQAITSASWRASSARSMSRRIRWAILNSRSVRTRIRSTYASLSPLRAASTRSRSTVLPLPGAGWGAVRNLLVECHRLAFKSRSRFVHSGSRPFGTPVP
jgi:hypothetical protein